MGTKGPSTHKASLPPTKNIAAVTPLVGNGQNFRLVLSS